MCQQDQMNFRSGWYLYKAQIPQIWSTNTKLFFLESTGNLKLSKKFYLHIGVTCKFIFWCFKGVDRIFWELNVSKRFKNAKHDRQIQKKQNSGKVTPA